MPTAPPRDEDELLARAAALADRSLAEIAALVGATWRDDAVRTKGKAGEVIERALGATGGSQAVHDFEHLGIELKTIPVDARGKPSESTYVCTVPLADAEIAEWETSWARAKLGHVLWMPLVAAAGARLGERRVGRAILWRCTPDQDAILKMDFDDAIGAIAIGRIESLDARAGRWLQVRPKAKDGSARTVVYGAENERIATVPRGFYLRARFTEAILKDPRATPP